MQPPCPPHPHPHPPPTHPPTHPHPPTPTPPPTPRTPPSPSSAQPSAKGLALQAGGWTALEAALPALSQAVEAGDDSHFVDLGGSKRASISSFKGEAHAQAAWLGGAEAGWRVGKLCVPRAPGSPLPRPATWPPSIAPAGRFTVDLREYYEKEGEMKVRSCFCFEVLI